MRTVHGADRYHGYLDDEDPVPADHTATAYNETFNTDPIPPGGHASFTFYTLGTYDYHCSPHQFMVGMIVVT